MKQQIFLLLIALFYSNCGKDFELDKAAIEYLIYDELSNEQINFKNPLLTEEYEEWKDTQLQLLEEDSLNYIKPFFVLNHGKDSLKMSLLSIMTGEERESHKEIYALERAIIRKDKITFLPTDYFTESKQAIPITKLSQIITNRYLSSDSLNQKCPEWWIIGEGKSDLIQRQLFEEMLDGYLDFTKKRFSKSDTPKALKEFLKEHKKSFPFRVSIEAPICRYGE